MYVWVCAHALVNEGVCAHVHVHMCMSTCACAHVCVCACTEILEVNLQCHSSGTLHLIFMTEFLAGLKLTM